MFVQNQPSGTQSHKSVIEELIRSSEEVRFMVAFVKEGGIDLLSDALKGKQAKLLCTFDLGITDLSAMKKLLDLGEGVEIREHRGGAGTFHPKVWMFRTGTTWRVVVGSANLTKAALTRNVEASVVLEDENTVKSALDLFDRLWKHKNSEEISLRNIASLKQVETRRVTRNRNILKVQPAGDEDAEAKVAALLEFVTSWMTIDVSEKLPGTDQRLWRGWYIIPDHGYVDDEKISRLKGYLRFVGDSGLALDKGNPVYNELISKFLDVEGLIGRPLSTSPHGLFVKQAKNYMTKFGWMEHPVKENGKPDKKTIRLTPLGKEIRDCEDGDISRVKRLYTEYFRDGKYAFMFRFTTSLLNRLGRLSFDEFQYFVTHAYRDDELETIVRLVEIFRSLDSEGVSEFKGKFKAVFDKEKEPTGRNVHGNYRKNVKYTMTALAWCEGFLQIGAPSDTSTFGIGLEGDEN